MTLNPEFQRNLWLEISLQRLVAMPVILGAVFVLAGLAGSGSASVIDEAAAMVFIGIVVFWGSRRAAASLAEEVSERTWDGQRMSVLGPWSLVLGKLFGATLFAWYGGVICLAVFAVFSALPPERMAGQLVMLVLGGLVSHAVALLACLTLVRKQGQNPRSPLFLSQMAGLGAAWALTDPLSNSYALANFPSSVNWYGWEFDGFDIRLMTLGIYLFWALIGAYRQMAAELQQRTWPWVWLAFSLVMMGFYEGYAFLDSGAPHGILSYLVGIVLVYAALFGEAKSVVTYRGFLAAFGSGAWSRCLGLMPLWTVAFALLLVPAMALMFSTAGGWWQDTPEVLSYFFQDGPFLAHWVVACLLFLLRDIGIVLFLNFAPNKRRADLAALVYLIVLYVVLGGIAWESESQVFMAFFWPIANASAMAALPVLAQVVFVWCLVVFRWRVLARKMHAPA